ncbi:MAG TPA: DUF4340 domain-containing protein [Candidatus Hydrogenedentes bacterium]|nr:DUF4340 domain-containing protein [Candidatus Hydrogenedentota bacterium]
MKPWTTLILVLVFVVLCAVYWFVVKSEQAAERRTFEAKKIFSFIGADIRGITIERAEDDPVSARRSSGGEWIITAPHAYIRPNPIVWERVANNFAGLTNERTIEEAPADLEKYELDEPELVVRGALVDGGNVEVRFGVVDPTQRFRYAQSGQPVFLVKTDAFFELNRSLDDLRFRNVFDISEEGITRIEYARIHPEERDAEGGYVESTAAVVAKGADGRWHMLEPVEALADNEYVGEVAKFLEYERGTDYIDAPESIEDYGLAPPRFRVTVVSGVAGEPETLYVGRIADSGDNPRIYAKLGTNPTVFEIDAHILNLIPSEPDSWREKRLMTHSTKALRALDYVAGETTFTLEKDEAQGWRLAGPDAGTSDQFAISGFLTTLRGIKAEAFVEADATGTGLDHPAIAITLHYTDEEQPGLVRVGAETPDGESRYVTQETGAVATAPKAVTALLEKTSYDFQSRELLRFAKTRAMRVALEFDGTEYVFEKAVTRWRVREPEGRQFESQSDMQAILDATSSVVAHGVVAEDSSADLALFGLANPVLTVEVATKEAEDAEELTFGPLWVGAITEDNPHERYAMRHGGPEVYRVRQDIVSEIREALRGVVEKE